MTRVRVADSRQIVDEDGTVHLGGETVEVPADVAEHWQAQGWASLVEDKPTTRRRPGGK